MFDLPRKITVFFTAISGVYCAQPGGLINPGFELSATGAYTSANSVSGWTLSSQVNTSNCNPSPVWTPGSNEFSIVSTPIANFPLIGIIPHSPLGGTTIAQLNALNPNASSTKLAQTFTVLPRKTLVSVAFAGLWQNGDHSCCDQSGFKILFKGQQGQLLPCISHSMIVSGANCVNGSTGYMIINNVSWTNWKVLEFDLTHYTGNEVTLEIISSDCSFGEHYGVLLLDMISDNAYMPVPGLSVLVSDTLLATSSYCSGSNILKLEAPRGYSGYHWIGHTLTGPWLFQSVDREILIQNPIINSNFTLQVSPVLGCIYSTSRLATLSSVTVAGLGFNSSCANGASGSATVVGHGSGTGYNYVWQNSTGSVVGTSSVVSGLSPGTYSVTLTASGSASNTCGTSTRTLTIGSAQNLLKHELIPYCGIQVYLNAPPGSNRQWYSGHFAAPFTPPLGSASGITVVPNPNSVFTLTHVSIYGCQDSIKYTPVVAIPGTVAVTYNKVICVGANDGIAVVSLSPALGAPAGFNSYSVFSVGNTPLYNSNVSHTSFNTFTVTGLSAGGTYSVKATEGSCYYETTFSVTPLVWDFTLTPGSKTLCPGNSIGAGVQFSTQPTVAQYTYSWMPATFLFGGNTNFQNTIITPTAASGMTNVTVYTVVVTPTIANCPITKTLSITALNPVTPTITPVPTLCTNTAEYTISVNPPGGVFSDSGNGQAIGQLSGVLTPSLAQLGVNTFTYSNVSYTCSASSTASYLVKGPLMNVTYTTPVCSGSEQTITANGADSYTWNNGSTNSVAIISPITSTQYTISGITFSDNCISTKTIAVNTIALPVISINGNTPVCLGSTATLTAVGGTSYTWTGVSTVTNTLLINPTVTETYTVRGSGQGNLCTNTAVSTVSVKPLPVVSMYGDLLICKDQPGNLYAMGADTYTWSWASKSVPGGTIIAINPVSNSGYTVTGTDQNSGCKNFAAGTVTVTNCSGFVDAFSGKDFQVYPNPATDNIFVECISESGYKITDAKGSVVAAGHFFSGRNYIETSGWTKGIYFLSFLQEDRKMTFKFVKNLTE